MAAHYVTPDPRLAQDFDIGDYKAMTPLELEDLEKKTNPHGVRTATATFHADFTLASAQKNGVNMKFIGPASRAFAEKDHPHIAASLKKMGKRDNLVAEVPTTLLVLGSGLTLMNNNMPEGMDLEYLINGLAPTHFSNNASLNYSGSHGVLPAGYQKVWSSGKSLEIHKAPANLALVSAIAVHNIAEEDLEEPILCKKNYNGVDMHIIEVRPNNPYNEIFKDEEGATYLERKLPSSTPVNIIANDKNSPRIIAVPDDVFQKANRAVKRAKEETAKHVQSLSTANMTASLFPVASGEPSFTEIAAHPLFAGLNEDELKAEMNAPRSVTISVKLTYIPIFGKA